MFYCCWCALIFSALINFYLHIPPEYKDPRWPIRILQFLIVFFLCVLPLWSYKCRTQNQAHWWSNKSVWMLTCPKCRSSSLLDVTNKGHQIRPAFERKRPRLDAEYRFASQKCYIHKNKPKKRRPRSLETAGTVNGLRDGAVTFELATAAWRLRRAEQRLNGKYQNLWWKDDVLIFWAELPSGRTF